MEEDLNNHDEILKEEPPLTLEEINDRLLWLETIATSERDLGEASRIILLAVISQLDARGFLSASGLATMVEESLSRIDDRKNVQIALQSMIGDIRKAVAWRGTEQSAPGRVQ
ncbi:hypothetical protein ACDY99_30640 [Achromobacter dolens]|uniref:hypothetical protein n=1 Tax=Achromobacter TaxID=222 RepID=UPI00355790FD